MAAPTACWMPLEAVVTASSCHPAGRVYACLVLDLGPACALLLTEPVAPLSCLCRVPKETPETAAFSWPHTWRPTLLTSFTLCLGCRWGQWTTTRAAAATLVSAALFGACMGNSTPWLLPVCLPLSSAVAPCSQHPPSLFPAGLVCEAVCNRPACLGSCMHCSGGAVCPAGLAPIAPPSFTSTG